MEAKSFHSLLINNHKSSVSVRYVAEGPVREKLRELYAGGDIEEVPLTEGYDSDGRLVVLFKDLNSDSYIQYRATRGEEQGVDEVAVYESVTIASPVKDSDFEGAVKRVSDYKNSLEKYFDFAELI